jgi:hypothetical protein
MFIPVFSRLVLSRFEKGPRSMVAPPSSAPHGHHLRIAPACPSRARYYPSMDFAAGLLELIRTSTPLALSFLKSLPTVSPKSLAVYLLVLEKPYCTPRLYPGSGTNAERGGAAGPLRNYNISFNVPMHVQAALDQDTRSLIEASCARCVSLQEMIYHIFELCSFSWKLRLHLSSGQYESRLRSALECIQCINGLSTALDTKPYALTLH